MEVQKTFIVEKNGKKQLLYFCGKGAWYITSNGAFGQRDTYIEICSPNEAHELIKTIQHEQP